VSSVKSVRSVRAEFEYGYLDVNDVVGYYGNWLSWIFYVICYRFNYSKHDYEYSAFRGLKRGDSRYSVLTCRKFQRLSRFGRNLVYFGHGSRGYVKGSGLHVVLEYDANSIDLRDAWARVGVDFNRFMSHVRKLYGKISVVRVWEAHESGYPHVHALLVFHDHVFSGYSSRRRAHLIYRVFGADYNRLKSCWNHGFSDIELVNSFSGGIRYLSKYLVKSTSAELAGVKGIRGLAMCWVFHKRSFSMSGLLFHKNERARTRRHDEISYNGNSNLNSYDKNSEVLSKSVGTDFLGNSIVERFTRWRLFGFCISSVVLWNDFSMHFVSRGELVSCSESDFNEYRSHYDIVLVSKPSRLSHLDGDFSRFLSEFV